jgi:O-antigen ligase
VLLLFSAGIAMILGYDLIVQRLQALTHLENVHSLQFRLKVWQGAFGMFQDFPVWGAGLGTFSSLFPSYQTFISDLFISYTENDYLQALTEMGIIGGILGLWTGCLYFYTTLNAWKKKHSRWSIVIVAGGISAMVSLLIHSWVDFNLHIPSNTLLFSVIAALNVVAVHSHRRSLR